MKLRLRDYAIRFAVALLTFTVGLSIVLLMKRAQNENPTCFPWVEIPTEQAIIVFPQDEPCPRPKSKQRIDASTAVQLAQCFIIENGYYKPAADDRQIQTCH